MKHLIIIANGLTDDPIAEKDNKTPLQLADVPNLSRLARMGRCGFFRPIPENLHAGSDVSFLSLLGYDPERFYAGPAYFDAVALNVTLNKDDVPLCCDFVALQTGHNDMIMKDYTAGHIPAEDADLLLDALQKQIANAPVDFYSGGGYHNLMVLKNGHSAGNGVQHTDAPPRLVPPNELIGEGIRRYMPVDDAHKDLVYIMNQAQIILHNHPYNKERRRKNQDPVNSIWLWGAGNPPALPSFASLFQKSASLITASSLLKGMALSAGMKTVSVARATGYADTNYRGKAESALAELETQDVVYLQVSACEEISLHGNIDDKILALEDFDGEIVGRVLDALAGRKDVKILLAVNHATSAVHMKYKKDAAPFVVYPARRGPDSAERFDEEILKTGSERFRDGPALIQALFKGEL